MMTKKTKITLSAKELELVCNKDWILTKHIIIEKVYQLFGTLSSSMQQHILEKGPALPGEAKVSNPKISRGENYKDLPYVMLDYPRYFTKEATLAVRTLFWWGNFFSINLHLSGACKEKAIPALIRNFTLLQNEEYWICVHTDPWQHHFEEDNYLPMEKYTAVEFAAILQREPFVKIAKRISLEQWDDVAGFLDHHFKNMMQLLQTNFPGGETGLLPGIPTTGSGL
ncbi:MAG: hypothetical protein ABIQ31_00065 [Ferruginibacter sp.]